MTVSRHRPFRIILAAIVLVAVGCNGSDDPDLGSTASVVSTTAGPTTTLPATIASTSPSTAPTTTTTDRASTSSSTSTIPPVVTSSDPGDPSATDWTTIVTDIYEQMLALPMAPSFDSLAELCLSDSQCEVERTETVEFLLDGGLHVEGGSKYRIDSVEYQGTLDDAPLDQALEVTIILRLTVTSVEASRLVTDDGSETATIPPDESIAEGQQYSQTVSLGRSTLGAPWQLSALGPLG